MSNDPGRKPSLFGSLPGYEETIAKELARAGLEYVPEALVCAGCEKPHPSVRSYSVPSLLFLVFFFTFRMDETFKCPRCMRDHLLARLPLALLMANVLAPFLMIWWFVIWMRTFRK